MICTNWTEDQWQMVKSSFAYVIEVFKLVMGCMLSVFVPQRCINQPDQICTLYDNFTDLISYNVFTLTYNFICLSVFIGFYSLEFKREQWCIHYLDHDSTKSETALTHELAHYPEYFERLIGYNRMYYLVACVSILFACTNIVFSGILILYYYYLDYRSITNIITNSLLILEKAYTSYQIAKSSKENVSAISAYLVTPIFYNTIDEDYRREPIKHGVFRVFLPSSLLQRLMQSKHVTFAQSTR
jgi:hypothetical protein